MSEPRYEPPRLRSVITRNGISGLATFDSMTTNPTSSTAAAAKNVRVNESVQPSRAASLNP